MSKISVIIITLNEEDYLPNLLDSIDKQEYEDYEVIVSDAKSTDNTQEIVRERGVRLVECERIGPAHNRNTGAKAADGDIYLFLDADTKLNGKDVLKSVEESLESPDKVVGTSTGIVFGDTMRGKILMELSAVYMKLFNWTEKIKMAPGSFQFIEKDIFEEIGGYNEELPYYEDEDMVERALEYGGLETLKRKFYISSRRVDEKGVVRTLIDYIPPQIYRMIGKNEKMKEKYSFETSGSN